MTSTEKTIAIIRRTAKLYPTANIFTLLKVLQLTEDSIHIHSNEDWILHRVESIFLTIKKDKNEYNKNH
jgi:hypothetical protein